MSERAAESGGRNEKKTTTESSTETEAASIDLANRVCTVAVERFGQSARVIHDREGDNVKETLALRPDLDPGLFIDELKGFDSLEVTLEYALSGKPEELAKEVKYVFTRGDTLQVVTFMRDEEPVIEQYALIDDEPENYQVVEPSVEWLFDMNNATKAVQAAIEEENEVIRDKREL